MGHTTESDRVLLAELEQRLLEKVATSEDILILALLYIEPAHDEKRAAVLLGSLLRTPPYHNVAAIWLAYLALHAFMDDDSLRRSVELLQEVVTAPDNEYRAAAHLLLAEIAQELGKDIDLRVDHIRASVAEAPRWVSNHHLLAELLSVQGSSGEAVAELRIAVENVISVDPAWSSPKREFERSISARTAYRMRERLLERILQVQV
jgi:hypothetical protein